MKKILTSWWFWFILIVLGIIIYSAVSAKKSN